METKKLTESAILSALMIVLSMVFIGTGIGYSLYLDFIVPVMIVLIYLRCGFKWTSLASFNVICVVAFVLGRLGGAIWMLQSVLIGMSVGKLINKKSVVLDDLAVAAFIGCLIMIIVDQLFAGILGFSILEQVALPEGMAVSAQLKEVIFYLGIASLPIGTTLMTYIGSLWLGHRLSILKSKSREKYQVMRQFIKRKSMMYLSKRLLVCLVIYLIGISLSIPFVQGAHLRAFCIATQYMSLYFVLNDIFSLLNQVVYLRTRSILMTNLVMVMSFIALCEHFTIAVSLLIGLGLVIDGLTQVRTRQTRLLYHLIKSS